LTVGKLTRFLALLLADMSMTQWWVNLKSDLTFSS